MTLDHDCRLFAIAGIALLTTTVGCVTKGKYEDLVADRNNVLEDRRALEQSVAALEVEVATLRTTNQKLGSQLEATEAEAAELRGTYEGLVASLESELAAGQIEVQQLIDGVRLNVSDELLFPSGATRLNETGVALLTKVAGQIAEEDAIISVEGHTDNVPVGPVLARTYPTNWELAGARAASVVRVLADNGVAPERLRAISRGPFAPVAPNDSEVGRAKNRRTEIILRRVPR